MSICSGYVVFYDRVAADAIQAAELRLLRYAALCIASSQSDGRGQDEIACRHCSCMTSDLVCAEAGGLCTWDGPRSLIAASAGIENEKKMNVKTGAGFWP
jgi:hypothetical protein